MNRNLVGKKIATVTRPMDYLLNSSEVQRKRYSKKGYKGDQKIKTKIEYVGGTVDSICAFDPQMESSLCLVSAQKLYLRHDEGYQFWW